MTTAVRKKLSAAQAIAWATAEVALQQAKAKVGELAEKCTDLRERYEDRLEPSDDPKDIDKDVKVGKAGGWQIRLTRFVGGDRFSLAGYREAGGKITADMEPHVHPGKPQVRVTVKRLAGPAKPGAVERS
ncbi:MAG: hypothetical protein M3376_01755 [Actinomycetota bacterium]|nr:hypothetical protein [Actinomycetota bacterium]